MLSSSEYKLLASEIPTSEQKDTPLEVVIHLQGNDRDWLKRLPSDIKELICEFVDGTQEEQKKRPVGRPSLSYSLFAATNKFHFTNATIKRMEDDRKRSITGASFDEIYKMYSANYKQKLLSLSNNREADQILEHGNPVHRFLKVTLFFQLLAAISYFLIPLAHPSDDDFVENCHLAALLIEGSFALAAIIQSVTLRYDLSEYREVAANAKPHATYDALMKKVCSQLQLPGEGGGSAAPRPQR